VTSNSFRLQYLPPEQYPRWDAFLEESTNGTIFQSTAYVLAVSRSFQREVQILAVLQQDQICGGVVLFPRKKFGQRYLTTPFFVPYNSFIVSKFSGTKIERRRIKYQSEVLEMLCAELEKQYPFIQMDLTPGITDFRCLVWRNWKFTPSFNIIIDLQKEQNLFDQIRRNQQRDIMNFEKNDYLVKSGSDVKVLFQLLQQSYRQHGIEPPLEEVVFETFVRELLDHKLANYFLIEVQGRPVAGLMVIQEKQRVYALFAGKDFQGDWAEAELYLHWHLMQYYREYGVKVLDLLGGMVDSIAHFKFGLGGTLFRYDQLYFFRNNLLEWLFKTVKKKRESKRILS